MGGYTPPGRPDHRAWDFAPYKNTTAAIWPACAGKKSAKCPKPEVRAAASGKVTFAGWCGSKTWCAGYGYTVSIEHPNGYRTFYAHFAGPPKVGRGSVKRGKVIGIAGDTGYAEGVHVHFQVEGWNNRNKKWVPANPGNPWNKNEPWSKWLETIPYKRIP